MALGCVSEEVEPWRSILPGCMLSIALTRAFPRRPLCQVAVAHPKVDMSLYVDDGSQYAEGADPRVVAKRLATAAVGCARMADELGLQMSVDNLAAGNREIP